MRDITNLPYRNNVACIVFKDGLFLIVQLTGWPDNFWKFPQGGVNEGESEEETINRELVEELGIKNYKIVAKSSRTNQYDWPMDSIEKANFRWKGQFQKFYLVKFLGKDEEIKIDKKEIQAWKWVDRRHLFEQIDHDHKLFVGYKDKIERVLEEFRKLF